MTKWLMTNPNHHNQPKNKNAFQWDAYRSLVDRITQHALDRGVCLPRRGVCLTGGCLPGVLNFRPPPRGPEADIPPVDRQTPVKT